MVAGFLAVPVFTFVVPSLGSLGALVANLSELPPSIVLSLVAGIVVSRHDRGGRERLVDVAAELDDARA